MLDQSINLTSSQRLNENSLLLSSKYGLPESLSTSSQEGLGQSSGEGFRLMNCESGSQRRQIRITLTGL